jgi:hypothetical protein
MGRDSAAPRAAAPPAAPVASDKCPLCGATMDREEEDLGGILPRLARIRRLSADASRRAVSVTCIRPGCDKDTVYHAGCVQPLYAKLGPKSSGAAVNRALTYSLDNFRLSGARARGGARSVGSAACEETLTETSTHARKASCACTACARGRSRRAARARGASRAAAT